MFLPPMVVNYRLAFPLTTAGSSACLGKASIVIWCVSIKKSK